MNIFKQRFTFIASVFPKLKTVKDKIILMSKKACFRTPFDSQHAKGSQALLESPRGHIYYIFSSLLGKVICKMSFLVICVILGHFFNTLTANDMYSLRNSDVLP